MDDQRVVKYIHGDCSQENIALVRVSIVDPKQPLVDIPSKFDLVKPQRGLFYQKN